MLLLHDRFVVIVIAVTAVIIAVMAVIHLIQSSKAGPTFESRSSPSVSTLSEQQSGYGNLQPLPSRGPFRVTRVLDGDTIVLDNGETVRLIGVDAPEIHHPEIPVQRFGEEAKEFLRRLVEGFECNLEYEPGEIRDQYGRLLAYVFVEGRLVNAEIIRRGYAYAYTRFPFRRQKEFMMLEQEAREKQYGLWHLSLRDGRITNLVKRYESLSMDGRRKLDEILEKLVNDYSFEGKETLPKEEKP